MHLFSKKQTTERGSINNSSQTFHQRTASEECCFANEQKTTVNRNPLDSFISFKLNSLVASDALMFCILVGCNYSLPNTTAMYLRRVTLDLHTLILSHLCALMMDGGWSNEAVLHPPTPIAILRSSLIWFPDKYGPEQQQ